MSLILAIIVSVTVAQRSPYAGSRPSGYKDRFKPISGQNQIIGNRFGNDNSASGNLIAGSTQRIPIDALQDREIYEILNRRPVDKQPFWFLNYQTIEAHRNPIRG